MHLITYKIQINFVNFEFDFSKNVRTYLKIIELHSFNKYLTMITIKSSNKDLTPTERQQILQALLKQFYDRKLKKGAIIDIVNSVNVYRNTVGRLWKRANMWAILWTSVCNKEIAGGKKEIDVKDFARVHRNKRGTIRSTAAACPSPNPPHTEISKVAKSDDTRMLKTYVGTCKCGRERIVLQGQHKGW